MFRIFLVLVLAFFCVGCASSKARAAAPVKVTKLIKIKSYGECKMMPNGYLVCPKEGRR
jgi:photosystem II stability/assembly factor-like uncharacterized protein